MRMNHERAAAVAAGTAENSVDLVGTAAATEAREATAEATVGLDAVAVAVEESGADNKSCNSMLVELHMMSMQNPIYLQRGRMEELLAVRQADQAVWESSSSKGVIGP